MRRLFFALILLCTAAQAQDRAGSFDYYVMALSWSPNWCALQGNDQGASQCDTSQDFGWILHGLWPQYEAGYPEYCSTAMGPPNRSQTNGMADIMGTSGLAWHQWRKHGVCTGLSSADYYALSRLAYQKINRPEVLRALDRSVTLPAKLIEEAFLQANPNMQADQITITCRSGYIQEARICLSRDLELRTCGSDVIRDCSLGSAQFDPIR